MTNGCVRTFATRAEATGYLEEAGFVFIGAPDRWQQIGETQTAYARITATACTFQIRFGPSKTI
jgi:hypothetical protein